MKYRVLDQNLTAVSQGEFHAVIENGLIDLPDDLARDFIAVGIIAPITENQEENDDRLRHLEQRQSRSRKQRDD
jgi:hypothetical protein